ncbi:MAG TPA: DUF72 domain-containing protein [Candidatus Limnocylindrales bacterium]|nr:DUF72 domain-containing protein [Candidatus Limnocylindrales bacterium]
MTEPKRRPAKAAPIGSADRSANPHDPGSDVAGGRAIQVLSAAAQPIELGQDATVRIGTASWTDPTMTAGTVFYPSGADTAEERLQYYASQFPLVEIDATYYALPARRTAELWRDRTPPDFLFDVKAHALMTGQPTEVKRLPKVIREALPAELAEKKRIYARDLPRELRDEVWAMFMDGLEPLREAGQLGSILLQYPRWFFPISQSRAEILEARELLGGHPFAVELRNASWFNEKNVDRTMRFLEDNKLPFVMVDEPQGFKSSVPPLVAVTSPDLAVMRFHGRRAETWEARDVTPAERFRYLYDRKELGEWAPRLRDAAKQTRDLHVLMNNCYANYGSTNARELALLLSDLKPGD